MNEPKPTLDMIATLQGEMLAMKSVMGAILAVLAPEQRAHFRKFFGELEQQTQADLLAMHVPDGVLQGFSHTAESILLQVEQP